MVSWTSLSNSPGNYASAMWLMQDGSVLANLYNSTQLMALYSDQAGSYVNGSWSSAGNFLLEKWAFTSAVLSDGRLVSCGGEYSGSGLPETETNFCEIYDPVTQSSTSFPAPPNWTSIGDGPSALLNDGTLLVGNTQGRGYEVALLDPSTLTWTIGGGDSDNEQGYVLLQTGDVLTANVYHQTSMRYEPGQKAFVQDANLPVMLGANSEIGPGLTLMDGRVIWFGASGHTCIYTPETAGNNGTWVQGPDLPTMPSADQLVTADVPAILEPNGMVFLAAAGAKTPTTFLEYDPVANQFTIVAGAPEGGDNEYCRMLLLPNGHGLVSVSTGSWYDVEFQTGGDASWAPTITCFPPTVARNDTVTLAGTQLCGLSECQSYGDDNQQVENYPMVRFVDSRGGVTYARAHDVSTRSIAPGQRGAVLVDIPGSLELAAYSVQLVAMGIPSAAGTTVNIVPHSLKFGSIMAPANEPYQWWWGLSGDEVGQKLQASQLQLRNIAAYVDLDDTVKFAAIMGPPTGQAWWWYWGLSGEDVGARLTENNAQLVDISPYIAPDGSLQFVVIMVGETGQGWWWYWGQSSDQVSALVRQNNAVLTKISPYWAPDGSLQFAIIMATNVGQTWWWYWGLSGADVGAKLNENRAALTDISAYVDQTDNTALFAVIMTPPTDQAWWWWWGLEACGIA
jgi:hypothetical protein